MGKHDSVSPLLGRRGFLQGCAVLGVGGLVFGLSGSDTRKTTQAGGFVVINGWVLPAEYFRKA
ncbi:MAG: twin-arginine translocation signal domain-containing protein [Pseudomonas putida]|uniref:twin-arginine translocation signal domain-containing protein n=2 Tax=Pseudomonas TaxID=286 RepID=UPI0018AAD159|nr:twin-arginine translocation signal domain-containing protein [Pseudomonas guariconensis]MDR0209365.1 twin-arginine translocation signal domain-containing protein [Pseudomonas putida]